MKIVVVSKVTVQRWLKTVSGSQRRKHCYCEEFKLLYETLNGHSYGGSLKAIFEHSFTITFTTGFLQITTNEFYLLDIQEPAHQHPPKSSPTERQVKKTCILPAVFCLNRCTRLAREGFTISDELICAEVNCN